ncbi:hypothetical protein ACFL2L_00780 [Patescibacteria group bacterium]
MDNINAEQNKSEEQDNYRRRFLARSAKAIKKKNVEQKKKKLASQSSEKKKNPYQKVQNVLTFIEGLSALTSITFISAVIFIVVAHGEWLVSILFNFYKLPKWKKVMIIIVDFIIFLIFLISIVTLKMTIEKVISPFDTDTESGIVTEEGESIPLPTVIGF